MVEKDVADVGIAVHVRLWPGVPQRVEATMVLDVERARGRVRGSEHVVTLVEDRAQPLCGEVGAPHPRNVEPRSDRGAGCGVREPGVEAREVLERACRIVRGEAPRSVRERAPAGGEVFEHQREATAVVRSRVIGVRDPQIDRRRDVRVELHLPLAHAGGTDHFSVRGVERCQLHEERCRARLRGRVREADAHALIGGGGVIEDLDVLDFGVEHLGQPRGRQPGGIGGKFQHRPISAQQGVERLRQVTSGTPQ